MPDRASHLQELIRGVATGDRAAFAVLYRETAAKLFGIAMRISGSREGAEDILQESFVAIWARAGDYDPVRGPVMGWLTTIVRHAAIDRLRHQRSRPEGHGAAESLLAHLSAPGRSDTGAELRALQRCLDELDPLPRRAIVLAYLYGLSREELGVRLEVSVGTVKSWLRRGLERLRRCLDP